MKHKFLPNSDVFCHFIFRSFVKFFFSLFFQVLKKVFCVKARALMIRSEHLLMSVTCGKETFLLHTDEKKKNENALRQCCQNFPLFFINKNFMNENASEGKTILSRHHEKIFRRFCNLQYFCNWIFAFNPLIEVHNVEVDVNKMWANEKKKSEKSFLFCVNISHRNQLHLKLKELI